MLMSRAEGGGEGGLTTVRKFCNTSFFLVVLQLKGTIYAIIPCPAVSTIGLAKK